MIQKYKIRCLERINLFRKTPSLNLLPSIEHDRKLRLAQTKQYFDKAAVQTLKLTESEIRSWKW